MYFYFSGQQLEQLQKKYQKLVTKMDYPWVAHPLFTFVSTSAEANNVGFSSPYNYPYLRQKNDFVIGVFGGSVADDMVRKTSDFQVDSLFKSRFPELRGKNLVFLNFAAACGKQPMQYQRFSHFARDIDYAISIEGFNEVEMHEPGADVSAPCRMLSLYGKAYASKSYTVFELATAGLTSLIRNISSSGLYHNSAATVFVTGLLVQQRTKLYEKVQKRVTALAGQPQSKLYPYLSDENGRDLYVLGAKDWGHYARLQLAVAKELKIPLLFVLQPNRLVKNSKSLSPEEITHLAAEEWAGKTEHVTRGYQELSRQLSNLKKKNPENFLDLSFMFKNHTETLYFDACCHFNDTGHKLIWSEIIKSAIKPPIIQTSD